MLVPTSVFWDRATHHQRRTLFRRSPAILLEGLQFSKGAGKDAEDEWHRWPADTSREARLRQMSLVTLPNPACSKIHRRTELKPEAHCLHTDHQSHGAAENNLLVMPALPVSVRSPLFCFLPAWALFNWIQTSDYLVFKDIPGLAFRCRKQIMESIQPLGVLASS